MSYLGVTKAKSVEVKNDTGEATVFNRGWFTGLQVETRGSHVVITKTNWLGIKTQTIVGQNDRVTVR